jgi:hypothetical protein
VTKINWNNFLFLFLSAWEADRWMFDWEVIFVSLQCLVLNCIMLYWNSNNLNNVNKFGDSTCDYICPLLHLNMDSICKMSWPTIIISSSLLWLDFIYWYSYWYSYLNSRSHSYSCWCSYLYLSITDFVQFYFLLA